MPPVFEAVAAHSGFQNRCYFPCPTFKQPMPLARTISGQPDEVGIVLSGGKDVLGTNKQICLTFLNSQPANTTVKPTSDKDLKGPSMSATKEQARSLRKSADRKLPAGNWLENLRSSDVSGLWTELHRVVSHHPLVRASRSAGLLVEEGSHNAYVDLTQELFVLLLSKSRFQHYLDTEMSDSEIEAEISQIELTNMLTAELRKRYPESYRLARRISTLIQGSDAFKRFDNIGNPEAHRRLADRLYGLAEWKDGKIHRDVQEMDERVKVVSFKERDTRMVGCTGDAQIVISNPELEKLIIRVFKAIDSPVDVRSLRSFVMSRLPIMDIHLVPVGGPQEGDDDDKMHFEFM